jgi:hypothetical protein
VDYKSDRVGPEGIGAHAGRYELQMTTYALAAARWLAGTGGGHIADATLYFLRPAEGHRFDPGGEGGARGSERIEALAARLAAARRDGQFDPAPGEHCVACPFGELCEQGRPCGQASEAVHR